MAREVILGLHGFSADSERQMHDAGVCLVVDGEVVAAIDEERLSRVKRDGRFPVLAFHEALRIAGLDAAQVTDVAFVDRRSPWQTVQVVRYALDAFLRSRVQPWSYLAFWARHAREIRRIPPDGVTSGRTSYLEHHRCHAASAYFTGPWENATVVTLDGMGDFSIGGSVSAGHDGKLDLLRRSNGYFSPGHFYMVVTEYLGFTPGRHEGKITGLAAHGDPDHAYASMEQIIQYRPGGLDFVAGPVAREFFQVIRGRPNRRDAQWRPPGGSSGRHAAQGLPGYRPDNHIGLHEFRRLWAGFSREDIAAAAQKRFEDVIAAYVSDAIRLVGSNHLAVAGGCFANVRLNQRLAELPEVDGIHVHPNMGDGGLSVGAALLRHHEKRARDRKVYRHRTWRNVYLGPEYTEESIADAMEKSGLTSKHLTDEDLVEQAASALHQGLVIGWFQGRMEYGPRALGHRSLLAAAVDASTPDALNGRLGRTEFMPFAPIIMEEHAREWFPAWRPDHSAARFMTITYEVEPRLAHRVPAVVHVDATARPQVLGPNDDALLHRVLHRYHERTGIPLLINTSFNMHEEPIVCTPADAVSAFCRGAADVLVAGSVWVTRTAT